MRHWGPRPNLQRWSYSGNPGFWREQALFYGKRLVVLDGIWTPRDCKEVCKAHQDSGGCPTQALYDGWWSERQQIRANPWLSFRLTDERSLESRHRSSWEGQARLSALISKAKPYQSDRHKRVDRSKGESSYKRCSLRQKSLFYLNINFLFSA